MVLLLFFNYISYSQDFLDNSPKFNINRTLGTSVLNVGLWSGSIGGLYFVWYKGFPKSKFHSFDDSKEW